MINVEELKRIIVSQKEENEEMLNRKGLIPREIGHDRIRKYLTQPNIAAILGVRRCGKSTLAQMLLEKRPHGYLNFDDERLISLKSQDLDKVLSAFIELYGNLDYFVFDEIQNVHGWELFVNRVRRTKKIIITGSNSRMLSGELATHLTGRHISIVLFPFSFREFLLYNNFTLEKDSLYSSKKVAGIKRLFEQYIEKGGFPESYAVGREILKKLYGDITDKDIIGRHEIKYKRTFKEMLLFLANNVSSEITFRKLGNIFGIKDQHTVKNYFSYAEGSYLFFIVERFSFKLKQRFISPRKIYCIDAGLLNSVSMMLTKNKGRVLENLVAVELMRRRHYSGEDYEVYYWKDQKQREVDFVIKKDKKITELIQVCHDISEMTTREREFKSLIKASEELKCRNLIVITQDHEDEQTVEGKTVKIIPAWKWLLE